MKTDLLQLMINTSSIFSPLLTLITVVSAIIGVIMVGKALMNAYILSLDNGQAWSGQPVTVSGIVWSLVIGGILVSPIVTIQIFGNTMFDASVSGDAFIYKSSGMTEGQQAAIKAIFSLFTIAGYIAFIRGWITLNKHFNGVIKDGVGTGITHIFGGSILVYLDIFLEALKNTTGFDVTFWLSS